MLHSKLRVRTRVVMSGFGLPAVAAVAIGLTGWAGGVASAATVPAAAVTCTDNWVGPASGTSNWATSADWSAGVPASNSVACIKKAGTYTVQATTPGDAAAAIVVGGAASGAQTLQIDGINLPVSQSSMVLKGGVLSLATTSSSGAGISAGGSTVSLTIAAGGTLSSTGTSNTATISTPLWVNKGTVSLGAASNNGDTDTTTDEGSFTVAGGSSFTADNTDFIHSAGKLIVHGTFIGENTFTQSGGTETGHPVTLPNATLTDSAGTGSFTFTGTGSTMTGTVPAGQTVTTEDNLSVGTSSTPVTVNGTLACEPQATFACDFSTNGDWPGITVAPGGTVSTIGSAGADANLYANIDVKAGGTLTIANPATMVNAYTLTNAGTWQVTATGNITIGGNCAVNSTGTIGVTVGTKVTGADGTIDTTNISGFTADGTLAVHTAGGEVGATVPVITTRSGLSASFSNLSFTPPTDTYTVIYTSTEVQVSPASG